MDKYESFIMAAKIMQQEFYQNSKNHGFYDGKEINDAEKICLMHSELSEALESCRHGDPPDDKVPNFSGMEAELADCIIRILDFAEAKNLKVIEAVVEKHKFNLTRPYKHGKTF